LISALFSSIDSANFQDARFQVIANNLANVDTNGFKKDNVSSSRSSFAVALKEQSSTDFSEGKILKTGNSLDVALNSPGFFKLNTDKGERYTRNGAFVLNSEGYLVNERGQKILGENGPIKLTGGQVSIGTEGTVSVDGISVDRLAVVDFKNRAYLVKEGNCNYAYTGEDSNIIKAKDVKVAQGFLEKSNVNPTEEMVKMMEMYRTYESNQKIIQTLSEMSNKMMSGFGLS